MSLTYTENSKGPKTDPCGIPCLTVSLWLENFPILITADDL